MAEVGSNNEQDKRVKQLKRDLEGWREVILPLNSILLWEKNTYPVILLGASTLFFLFFWYLDPSVLTTIAISGLMATLVDHLVPSLTASFCNPDNWTGNKERKLEEICRNVSSVELQATNYWTNFYNMRTSRPKMYYVIVVTTLVLLAWLGHAVNNLLLTYFTVTLIMLLPGMQHQGILKKYFSQIMASVSSSLGIGKDKKN